MPRPFALFLLLPAVALAQGTPKARPADPEQKPVVKPLPAAQKPDPKADQKPAAVEQKAAEQKGASTPEAQALAEKVQRFYEKTSDFTATFDQAYKYKAMGQVKKSSGTVQVKKPGMMRWDYEKPFPKQFILDGKTLYMFDPEENQVMMNRHFSTDSLSAAVTFLWGKGKLTDEFDVVRASRPDLGATVLQLTPKRAQPGFTKLLFALDDATGAVKTSVVFDTQGNENTIAFSNVKTNTGVAESRFQFQVPKGAAVSEWK